MGKYLWGKALRPRWAATLIHEATSAGIKVVLLRMWNKGSLLRAFCEGCPPKNLLHENGKDLRIAGTGCCHERFAALQKQNRFTSPDVLDKNFGRDLESTTETANVLRG